MAVKFQSEEQIQVLKMMINSNNIRIRRAIVTEELFALAPLATRSSLLLAFPIRLWVRSKS